MSTVNNRRLPRVIPLEAVTAYYGTERESCEMSPFNARFSRSYLCKYSEGCDAKAASSSPLPELKGTSRVPFYWELLKAGTGMDTSVDISGPSTLELFYRLIAAGTDAC